MNCLIQLDHAQQLEQRFIYEQKNKIAAKLDMLKHADKEVVNVMDAIEER